MTFHLLHSQDAGNARSPFRIIEQPMGHEVEWINRFLDREYVRRLAGNTLRSYALDLLHFLRWWVSVNHTSIVGEERSTDRFLSITFDSRPAITLSPRRPPSIDAWASWSAPCATSFPIRPVPSRLGFTISIGAVHR